MDESQLSAILDTEQRQAIAYSSSELSKEREESLKYYYGEPFGNEEDGHSKVVVRDVQDVVESVLPYLLKTFCSGDTVVEYQPRGPEDEEIAKQRTEYINYVFQNDNPGFLLLYTAFKDALMQKNGVVKVYYDKSALDETRTLKGIDEDAYALLLDDPDVEIIAETESTPETSAEAAGPSATEAGGAAYGAPGPGTDPYGQMPGASQGMSMAVPPTDMPVAGLPQPPSMLRDVKYRKKGGKVCIESVAPEEFLLSKRCRAELWKTPYAADRRRKTLSDLIDEGLLTEAEALALGGDDTEDLTSEATIRRTIDGENDIGLSDREGVMREVWVTDHYILVDYDEDGIAERRRIITAGSTSNILLNEEWEGPPPYASGSPVLITHRVIGQSLADLVMDLQLINSTLLRQALDNLYRTNNPRTYLRDGVDLDDYLNPQPGGKISVIGNPNEYVREATVPFTAGASMPMLEYLSQIRENRTGITRYNQGTDADSLNKTASGITQIMTAAQQRFELIARILAETFVKQTFMLIDHCVTKYQDKERVIRIRNEWVTVDPRQWESNFDMTINVGLGTGNKDQMLMHLQMIAAMQKEIIMLQGGADGPLVTMPNVHQVMTKLTENAGLRNAELYFTDPAKAPPQEPKPDPEMAKVQQQGEIEKQKLALQAQSEEQKLQLQAKSDQQKFGLEVVKTRAQIDLEREKAAVDIQMQREKTAVDMQMNKEKHVADVSKQREKMQGDQELGKEKLKGDQDLKRSQAMNDAAAQDGAGDVKKSFDDLRGALDETSQKIDKLASQLVELMSAEREVVRDEKGRAQGVRLKQRMD